MNRSLALCALVLGCSEYNVGDNNKAPASTPEETPPEETTETTPDTTPTETTETTPGSEPPAATAPVYAHTSDTLYEIDPIAPTIVEIGMFHTPAGAALPSIIDIAIDLDGSLYAGSDTRLYRVDPTTAETTVVCTLSSPPTALTFTSDGVLFAGSLDRIVAVDTTTCETTPLLSSSPYSTSGDLVGLPDGYLYWTVVGAASDELVRVDPNTGDDTWVGRVGEWSIYGLGYALDNLYGFSSGGTITRIDPTTGDGIEVYDDFTSWWGATTNPVTW